MTGPDRGTRILFLCTGNSCRSQMAEAGVDILHQRSKSVGELPTADFDYVVTLCDGAKEACPYFPARVRIVHRAFDDPPKLAAGARDEVEALTHYCRVRNEIRAFIEMLPAALEGVTEQGVS